MDHESTSRECPYCKEEIKAAANKCKHCGSAIAPERPSHEGTCPYCKEQIQPEAIRCKHCKSDLRASLEGHSCGCKGNHSEDAATFPFRLQAGSIDHPSFPYDEWASPNMIFQSRFPSTLPKCGWRRVVCGSALPGYPVPMCWEYYCYFPGSSRNALFVE
jgi:hypothetical protein